MDQRQENWVEQELAELELGDQRLNKRARRIVSDLSRNPSGSIPEISGSWAATKAAYDFFDNDKVKHELLVAAQRQATLERVKSHKFVLCVQDTTEINLTRYPSIEGQGWLARNNQTGVFAHTTFAVSAEGVPLGVLAQTTWIRPDKADPKLKSARKTQRPIEEKESYKWLQALKTVTSTCPSQSHLLFVSDAESDIHEYFTCERPATVDVLVRACHNRCLVDSDKLLWPTLRQTPLVGEIKVAISPQEGRPQRTATCQVRYRRVTLQPSNSNRTAHLPRLEAVTVSAILVGEINPPNGEDALCWLLLTTLPVDSFDEAQQIITFYTFRWRVERFHFVLKSGCALEQRRLDSVTALGRFLALANLVAWRLLWLTYVVRVQPDAPCSLALAEHEWQPLYWLTHGVPWTTAQPPSLHMVVQWLAQLGGFLARSADRPPGVQVLWRGWIALMPAVRLYSYFFSPPLLE